MTQSAKVSSGTSPNSDTDGVQTTIKVDSQRRYDRGIRVWGTHGQEALERARICLLNCGPTGAEALKNMVLGGIHSFTIVDGRRVEAADVGNNYLVTASALGTSRAQCVADCLKELNDTVAGSYVEEEPAELITANPAFFSDFDLVIATQLREPQAAALDILCRKQGVALLLARSYGLVGYLRNCVAEHCIVESKPDSEVNDLRFGNPWPELAAAAQALDLSALDEAEHSHVPYGLLLVKAVQTWQDEHGGKLPATTADRNAFKDLLRSWQRTIDDCPIPEENFGEAVSNAHKVWAAVSMPSEVKTLLEDEAAADISPSTPDFWVLAAALQRFVRAEGAGLLPLEGSLPDMHASTQRYLDLQRIYRDKAEADAVAVEGHVHAVLKDVGRAATSIPAAEIRRVCRHARHLRVVRVPPLEAEGSPGSSGRADALRTALASEESSADASLHVLLHAADRFHARHQRYPGAFDTAVEEDVAELKGLAGAVLLEAGVSGASVCDDLVGEVVRFGAGEVQVVAAVVGAMASQEAIKLLTKQCVPLKGTLVYNAMRCTMFVMGG